MGWPDPHFVGWDGPCLLFGWRDGVILVFGFVEGI